MLETVIPALVGMIIGVIVVYFVYYLTCQRNNRKDIRNLVKLEIIGTRLKKEREARERLEFDTPEKGIRSILRPLINGAYPSDIQDDVASRIALERYLWDYFKRHLDYTLDQSKAGNYPIKLQSVTTTIENPVQFSDFDAILQMIRDMSSTANEKRFTYVTPIFTHIEIKPSWKTITFFAYAYLSQEEENKNIETVKALREGLNKEAEEK